jgi:hypothetical protein
MATSQKREFQQLRGVMSAARGWPLVGEETVSKISCNNLAKHGRYLEKTLRLIADECRAVQSCDQYFRMKSPLDDTMYDVRKAYQVHDHDDTSRPRLQNTSIMFQSQAGVFKFKPDVRTVEISTEGNHDNRYVIRELDELRPTQCWYAQLQ